LSCRYTYASVRGFCPICGAPAPSYEVLQGLHEVKRLEKLKSDEPKGFPVARSVIFAAAAILIAAAWLFLRVAAHKEVPSAKPLVSAAEASPPAKAAVNAPEPESEAIAIVPASQRSRIESSTAQDVPADDSMEALWVRVRHGDVRAEISLATRYMNGAGVPQNCEQAHLLLSAAAKKKNSGAEQILAGDYRAHCP
jgi:TPR repeat protein